MSKRGWLLFTAMGVIWGIPYLLIKVADEGVSVPVLVCTRTAIGALLLLPVALRGGHLAALKGTPAGWPRSPWWRSSGRGRCCQARRSTCPVPPPA